MTGLWIVSFLDSDCKCKEKHYFTHNPGYVYISVYISCATEEEALASAKNAAREYLEDKEEVEELGYIKVKLSYMMQRHGSEGH